MKDNPISINSLRSVKFSNIESSYTFEAKGVNIDYMLLVVLDNTSRGTKFSKIAIDKLHENIFAYIKKAYKDGSFGNDGLKVISYLRDSEIINISKSIHQQAKNNFFNYCVKLSDRHQPQIEIDINNKLDMYYNKISKANIYYKEGYFYQSEKDKINNEDTHNDLIAKADKVFKELIDSLNKDLCTYIILWIHAYRFLKTRQMVSSKKENILYSHRYIGWSQPRYRLDQDLEIEFNTNFGYGMSSYFHLIIIYKNIHLVNFVDWIDYRIKGVSQIKKYTRKYQGSITGAGEDNKFINDSQWENAIEEANLMCQTYLNNYNEFIGKFVLDSLESMVSSLEEIVDISIIDGKFNRTHRLFEETFKSKLYENCSSMIASAVVMSVKASKISGALELTSNILELDRLFSTKEHILKIKNLNARIYPLIIKEIDEVPELLERTKREIDKTIEELKVFSLSVDNNTSIDRHIDELKKKNKNLNNDLGILRELKKDMNSYARNIKKYIDLESIA